MCQEELPLIKPMFTNNVNKNKERSLDESQSITSVNQNTD